MRCSFIVSAFNQPDALASLLYALKIQTERDHEIIVCDNSPNRCNLPVVARMDLNVRYTWTGQTCADCYQSANAVIEEAHGDYLCFPSCDCYYVPTFLEEMLKPGASLTYCSMLYDPRGDTQIPPRYRVIDVSPQVGCIDKGGFLIRRDKFPGFPWRDPQGDIFADGLMIEGLIKSGIDHAKVNSVLWCHN